LRDWSLEKFLGCNRLGDGPGSDARLRSGQASSCSLPVLRSARGGAGIPVVPLGSSDSETCEATDSAAVSSGRATSPERERRVQRRTCRGRSVAKSLPRLDRSCKAPTPRESGGSVRGNRHISNRKRNATRTLPAVGKPIVALHWKVQAPQR